MPRPEPRPYVMAWRLWDKRVVIVGGGAIGEGKIETLLSSGAKLVVIDPTPSKRVDELAADGTVTLHRRRFCPLDFFRATLVVAATGDSPTNARITRWSHIFGAVVNAVDDPGLCDVTVPSVIQRGPATIAVTTNGATPAGARFLREEVSRAIPEEVGDLLTHASIARHELRESGAYRYDYAAWRQMFFEPGLDAIKRQRPSALTEVRQRFTASFASSTTPLRAGRITLVGAGPGGVDLITVRGARALAAADVVLYDRLADPELLSLAPAAAIRIPVGKGKGFGTCQASIGELLVEHAKAGSHVVRLKGGDPFVFGRGSEEVERAILDGIEVDVVPGLSSSLAAPALAGISLTDRRFASGFAVISGHRASNSTYDWESFASNDLTIVALMAASTAADVADKLVQGGRTPGTPVAFVHRAGCQDEQVSVTSLAEVSLHGCPFGSPTVMVIGKVAAQSNRQVNGTPDEYQPAVSTYQ